MVILKKMMAVNSTALGRHHALNLGLKHQYLTNKYIYIVRKWS